MADLTIVHFRISRSATGAHVRMDSAVEIHDVESLNCWCLPRFYLPCDECGDVEASAKSLNEPPKPGCWKCAHGLVELTRKQADAATAPLVIVHRD